MFYVETWCKGWRVDIIYCLLLTGALRNYTAMPIARQGLGCKIYFLFDFAVLKINSNHTDGSPGWFAWKRPKKETQSGCKRRHMCFRRLALRRCTVSQNNLRAIKQVLCDSELIRTEKSFSSILTFGSIFFSNSSSKARNNGASSQVSKPTRALFKAIELTLVVKILIRRRQRNNWEQLSSYRPPSRL